MSSGDLGVVASLIDLRLPEFERYALCDFNFVLNSRTDST